MTLTSQLISYLRQLPPRALCSLDDDELDDINEGLAQLPDEDALTIYECTAAWNLPGDCSPNYIEVGKTSVFQYGKELYKKHHGWYLGDKRGDPDWPPGGNIDVSGVSDEDLTIWFAAVERMRLQQFKEAWERQFPAWVFPVRIVGTDINTARVEIRNWRGEWLDGGRPPIYFGCGDLFDYTPVEVKNRIKAFVLRLQSANAHT